MSSHEVYDQQMETIIRYRTMGQLEQENAALREHISELEAREARYHELALRAQAVVDTWRGDAPWELGRAVAVLAVALDGVREVGDDAPEVVE